MPRLSPHVTVSAVVSPALYEEIARLAASKKTSKSDMVRQLLEERLTQRANERMEDAYDRLEKRLARIEKRFSGLIVKNIRLSAQEVYLSMRYLEEFTEMSESDLQEWYAKAKLYAAKQLQVPLEDEDQGAAESKKK